MIVFDRILNENINISDIERLVILGRYIFREECKDFRLNESEIIKQDFLVPCRDNEGLVKTKTDKIKIHFQNNELLDENISSLIKHSLLEVSEELDMLLEDEESSTQDIFDYIKGINVLLRNFDERLEISEFEKYLQKKLFHIEEVCRDPAYHLKREITKVNVAKAKRIPYKAINYLAAHTEDWARRRIRSVEPRRILSEIYDYDLGIYENRITTSFIDKLLIYFSHRMINEIEVIDNFIEEIERIVESRKEINSERRSYWYKKLDRDYSKLGNAVETITRSREKVDKIKEFIASIQMRLYSLLKSDLYLANSGNKNIASQKLKRTNLFDNHQHYRFVKILWEKFHKKEQPSCQQKSEEAQKVVKSFIDYSLVLILRSFFQIGFTELIIRNKNSFELHKPNFDIMVVKITIDDAYIIHITIGNENVIFIPLPATKETGEFKLTNNRYLLTLFDSENSDYIIKISPTDINSEERITSIFFRRFLEVFKDKYFYKLNSQVISQFKILENWLKNNSSLILDKGKNNKIDFWLKRKLNNNEILQLTNVIKEQKADLSHHSDICSKQLERLNAIEKELSDESKEHFEKYEICISCHNKNQSNIIPDYEGGFKYKCDNRGCEVEYGFTRNKIFYKVHKFRIIYESLSKRNNKIDDDLILNAFGYEYI